MLERRSGFQVSIKTLVVEYTMMEPRLFWDVDWLLVFIKALILNAFCMHCLNHRQVLAETDLVCGWEQIVCFIF